MEVVVSPGFWLSACEDFTLYSRMVIAYFEAKKTKIGKSASMDYNAPVPWNIFFLLHIPNFRVHSHICDHPRENIP